jgi:D-alanyl-D-alanine carboxypeptidase
MTAALVVGLVDLDAPIGTLLPAADLAGLPVATGVDVGRAVTVEQLLAQTSGLPDYFEPPRGHTTQASAEGARRHRDRRWTPTALLDEARTLPPVGRPGERFRYSDTNWVLLARIAEEAGGAPFATLLRTRVFEPSDMERASTPYDATVIPDDLSALDVAPFWIGRDELSRAHSVSLDWAGGNVVAPAEDFVRFQRAFHGGRLVPAPVVARLLRPRNRFRRGIDYGAGTMTIRFGGIAPPWRGLPAPVGHLGYWAVHVFHYPERDAQVVLTLHTDRRMAASFRVHARIARELVRSS